MRVIVTGSAGFVGRHMVASLRRDDHDVLELDRKTGYRLDRYDDSTISGLANFAPEMIIHLASSVSTPGSVERPIETFSDTVCTTVTVMEAARQARCPVILTSSVKARDGRTPYGAAKRMVETWATEYIWAYGVPVLIDRPGTIYGPGQEGSLESGWIAWFLRARQDHSTITIDGDGHQRRDLLHVDDYVALMRRQIDDFVLGKQVWSGQVWDVGGGVRNVVSVLEMARYLRLDYVFGPERYGDAREYVGENTYPDWAPSIHWKDDPLFLR